MVSFLCFQRIMCFLSGCQKFREYVILKTTQGHMINMALFYHVYEVGVKDS